MNLLHGIIVSIVSNHFENLEKSDTRPLERKPTVSMADWKFQLNDLLIYYNSLLEGDENV
jgi:hypothetical protein